jgi:hypothetical protein
MRNGPIDRRLNWIALNMLYIAGPALIAGLAMLIGVGCAMTKVVPTRPADCEKALALLVEARALLEGLVERGDVEEGSPPDFTRWYLDDAIGMLMPEDEEVADV